MQPAAIWRSRPVFVTSTFRDMHAERGYLQDHVFPELAERLRERYHHLEPIDLQALQQYQQALSISEDLLLRAPDSAEYARDLVVSYYKLAEWHRQGGNAVDSRIYLDRCLATLRDMRAKGMYIDSPLAQLLEILETTARARWVSSGLASVAHPRAGANKPAQLNLDYQQAKKEWQKLPWWKRLLTKEPQPPTGN